MELLRRNESATSITPPLSQAAGYVVVVVIGLIFAFGKLSSPEIQVCTACLLF